MRCYNGCPDDELQSLFDSREEARAKLKKADPKAWCTYFPMEAMYMCSRWIPHPTNKDQQRFQSLTDEFHPSVESACAVAIERINELDNEKGET